MWPSDFEEVLQNGEVELVVVWLQVVSTRIFCTLFPDMFIHQERAQCQARARLQGAGTDTALSWGVSVSASTTPEGTIHK